VEMLGFKVRVVVPERANPKITTEDDLVLAKLILADNDETWN